MIGRKDMFEAPPVKGDYGGAAEARQDLPQQENLQCSR